MTKPSQSTTAQDFDAIGGRGTAEAETPSQFLRTSAERAVRWALAPADFPRKDGSDGGDSATRTHQSDDASDHTLSSRIAPADVNLPLPRAPALRRDMLHALQEWEGYVVGIDDDEFVARLVDLSAGKTYESEEAVIPLEEVSEDDASRMAVGSIFRWVIGYERSPEGTRKRVSQIVFRDLPRMTEGDLRAGREWTGKIAPALNP